MARRKPKDTPALESLTEVDGTLRELGEIQRDLLIIEAAAQETVDAAKAKAKAEGTALIAKRKSLEAALEQYAIHHSDNFKKRRSRKLTFGKIGFRKGTGMFKTLKGWNWTQVLADLKRRRRSEFIRTKEETNREALEAAFREKKLTDDQLAAFGLKWDTSFSSLF